MSALSDWARATYEALQDCPSNEVGWEILEEAGQKLQTEAEVARDAWWKARGHSDDC